VPELAFFVGKGGVGKTTVSSAYAVRLAARHPQQRVLLVSTDPAHSLSDLFELRVGSTPKTIPVGTHRRLTAWEIDSQHLFRTFVDEHRDELIQAVERGSLFTADEISSLLDTALPGMSEMGALLAIQKAIESGKYSTIVVDTAPFGHTLRLFGLPEQFSKLLSFLELAAERDQVLAQHFGGSVRQATGGFVGEWREKLRQIRNAFASAQLFLVTTAEEFALNESIRCIRAVQEVDPPLRLTGVILNRVVRSSGRCSSCATKTRSSASVQRRLKREYKGVDLCLAADPGFPILGVRQLKTFGDAVFGRKAVKWHSLKTSADVRVPEMRITDWPALSAPLTFVLGKGGVGKTTVSAALGFHSRETSNDEVEVCSVDPAPSLDDVFQSEVSDEPHPVLGDHGFRASELDSLRLYKSWVAEMRAEIDAGTSVRHSGVQVDLSYERRLFSELLEIVPPGLDEVLAIFRIIEMSQPGTRKVIIDMAPTGHALELLRTPDRILVWARLLLKSLASHRKLALAQEAAVKIAELEVKAREFSHALKSSGVAVYAVMLPEPLPDRETERLLRELGELGIEPEAVFVNRVTKSGLFPGKSLSSKPCARCRETDAWQMQMLSGLKKRLGVSTVYTIPAADSGPAGKRGLREITRKLWQLS
jgi:arsenite/tail-anchored protein-transporting ATPase